MNIPWIIILLIALTAGLGAFAILSFFRDDNDRFVDRYNKFKQVPDLHDWEAKLAKEQAGYQSSIGNSMIGMIRSLAGESYWARLQKLMTHADIPLRPTEFFLIKLLSAGLTYLMSNSMGGTLPMSVLFAITAWWIPTMVAQRKKARRLRLFEQQLSDILDLIVTALRSGQSFIQAMAAACEDAPYPIGKEFNRVMTEMRLGIQPKRAMQGLAERVPSQDVEMIVVAYIVQNTVGSSLAEVFEHVSATIRERVKIRGHINALTAQGRMTGIVIGSLPAFLAILIYLINPEFIRPFIFDPIGKTLITIALFMQMIGVLIIRKIVQIDF